MLIAHGGFEATHGADPTARRWFPSLGAACAHVDRLVATRARLVERRAAAREHVDRQQALPAGVGLYRGWLLLDASGGYDVMRGWAAPRSDWFPTLETARAHVDGQMFPRRKRHKRTAAPRRPPG